MFLLPTQYISRSAIPPPCPSLGQVTGIRRDMGPGRVMLADMHNENKVDNAGNGQQHTHSEKCALLIYTLIFAAITITHNDIDVLTVGNK